VHITELVNELIAAGTPPGLAASVIARAFVAGAQSAPFRNDIPLAPLPHHRYGVIGNGVGVGQ
jgi:hypothetical protein